MNMILKRQLAKATSWQANLGLAVLGSGLITLCAWIQIPLPFTPVPISLQSLAVIFLATVLGRKKMMLVMGAYLVEASVGLPVLVAMKANPLWFLGPTAGFLVGFTVIGYLMAYAAEKNLLQGFWSRYSIATLALLGICTFGTLYLSIFVGFTKAFQLGFLPFLAGELFKAALFATITKKNR